MIPSDLRARWRADAGAAVFLLVVALAFHSPLVFLGRALVDYDALLYFSPQRAYLAQSLREASLPLWNPYLFLGAPFLANPQAAVLYPPSWLFVLGPVPAVYAAQLVLHTFLAAFFAYLLARYALDTSTLAALVAGLSYGFGGLLVGQAGHLNQLSAAAWLPAILLAYDRAVRRSSPPWAGLGAVALGLQVLAGHPQVTFMSALALALFGLIRAPWLDLRRFAWAAAAGLLVGGLGALLAAAQLLPTLELVPLSIRGQGVRWEDAVAGSLPVYLLPRTLLPPFWLDVASTEYLGYVGVVALTLALLALIVVRSRMVLYGFSLCLLAIVLAPGENNGWYGLLFQTVPGLDTFRVPARWLFLWTLGASLLAAQGADWIGRGAWVWLRRPDLWVRLVGVALVLAAALAWQQAYGEPLPQRRTAAVWLALAGGTLATGVAANFGFRRAAVGALVLVAAAELWAAAGWSPVRRAPYAAPVASQPAVVAWLRASAEPSGRLLSVAQPDFIPLDETGLRRRLQGLPESTIRAGIVAVKWQETLAPNLPLQWRLRAADGYDGGLLPLQRFVLLSGLLMPPDEVRPDGVLQSRLAAPPDARLLDLLGVRYVLADPDGPVPPDVQVVDLGDVRLDVRRPTPRSLLVFNAGQVADEAAQRRLAEPTFQPGREVLLAPDTRAAPLIRDQEGVPVEPSLDVAGWWRARVSVPARAYLLQREAWYPGWRARVDGAEAPVLRADVLFRAVLLEPGEHDVEVFYDAASFSRGLLLTLLGSTLVGALLAWPVWRRRLASL